MARLPGILAEIADVAGEPAAVMIAALKGGRTIYIPARVSEQHWLVDCVGRELAEKICRHFSADGRGQYFEVPIAGTGVFPQLRRMVAKRIHELDQGGASMSKIAGEVGVTTRTVRRHRRAHKGGGKDARQRSLF